MVEPSKPEDWSNPNHTPEIWLEGETGKIKNTAAKSCKGLLYFSSRLKAQSKNPICVGFTRSHPNFPEVNGKLGPVAFSLESKEERTKTLFNFRFACVGYSAYSDRKGDHNFNGQEIQTELPGCIGLYALHKEYFDTDDSASAPPFTHLHNRKDGDGDGDGNGSSPQRGSPSPTPTPTNSTGEGWV